MNNNAAFADAARPARAVVLRLPMLPYSIGHELLLTQEANPLVGSWVDFLKLPMDRQIYSVIRAATICSKTWEENKKPDRWTRLWLWLNRNSDYPFEIANFRNYREAGSTFPAIGAPTSDGRFLGSPFLARLLAFHGVDSFDVPLGYAQWLYFAHAEQEGACKVLNDNEASAKQLVENFPDDEKQRIAKLMKERMKAKGVKCPD
jgi:hypothetical protein